MISLLNSCQFLMLCLGGMLLVAPSPLFFYFFSSTSIFVTFIL